MINQHTFHIPVMGIGFTIDTPLKVAHFGIDSVVFISDDAIIEKMRKFYSEKFKLPYYKINDNENDCRAKRITDYLNLLKNQVERKFNELKKLSLIEGKIVITENLKKYFNLLPNKLTLKKEFDKLINSVSNIDDIKNWLSANLKLGEINVNIMTKLDKTNYVNKTEALPIHYNDAHASLRGFANSNLESSVIFSAGMNPRLFSYIDKFDDFFPDEYGNIKKRIVLKVSDYRSALIQGKFLAKKGIWVSEYRIESGLNCGGHAFATEGYLMGPILDEFKKNKQELIESIDQILINALRKKGRTVPKTKLKLKITAQGGVGTAEEHKFLLNYYQLDSIGWGSPFLLVPEVTNVDEKTIEKLSSAKENDLYLSNISPLGVPFNNLRGNTKDIEKQNYITKGRPGSACHRKYLALNSEFTEQTICTASRQYQNLKLKELDNNRAEMSQKEYNKNISIITSPTCICLGLETTAYLVNDIERKIEGDAVSICPGPNMAYFSKKVSLLQMAKHIYGETNLIDRQDRPNMFIKELYLYLNFLKDKINDVTSNLNLKEIKYFNNFTRNLKEGIEYYKNLLTKKEDFKELENCNLILAKFENNIQKLITEAV
ncbi:MAG TPA: hypothetical protein EYG85_05740 [Crocinitomix sp.]|nr:hypothetical protein [Crocinitomix sp.]